MSARLPTQEPEISATLRHGRARAVGGW